MDANPASFDIIDIALRLGAAVAVGMLIGVNRDLADKPIGMRTLGLVSLGAAIVSISTVHFQGLADHPDALSRVVQGVVQGIMAGIGFIGAGVILRDTKAQTVRGLITASTVWVTAALGIALRPCRMADRRYFTGACRVPACRGGLARRRLHERKVGWASF